MKGGEIDTNERIYLLTTLLDGHPAIALHKPYSQDGDKVQIVAMFANTEAGHELAEEICSLKNDRAPYFSSLMDAQCKTATAVQNAALGILEATGNVMKKGDAA